MSNRSKEIPSLVSGLDAEMESDGDDDDWSEEENMENESTICLFCDEVSHSIESAIGHLENVHSINLRELKRKFNMDCYSYIKMINYIRVNKSKASEFQNMNHPFWTDDMYLKPVEFEPWLTYDFESLEECTADDNINSATLLPPETVDNLKATVERLEREILEKNMLLQQASENIATMQSSFKNLIEKESLEPPRSKTKQITNSIIDISLERDDSYFSSYSHYGIHHEMLSDEVRTMSYRNALLGNADFINGKSVLDVGCGTSILSMFAAKAGADVVVAVDNSEIIYQAMEIVKTNNFENIKFVKGRLEDTELPVDKFDVIVSEWMGYFLVFEGMLDSIIYARDKHLKLGGTLLPNRCNISIVGNGDLDRHKHYIGFWKNVYDFDMSCMQKEVLHEAMIDIVKPEYTLTEPNVIAEYDLMKVDVNYSNFSYEFNLRVLKDGYITSFVGYFDIFFDLPNKVSFSTSPESKPTHWKQVTFFIKDPVQVKANDFIKGTFVCRRNIRDMRSLTVRIKVFEKEFNYSID